MEKYSTEHRHQNQNQKRRRKMLNTSKFNALANFGGGGITAIQKGGKR